MRSFLSKMADSIVTALCIALAFIVGIGAAVLTFSKYLIPKWRREEQAETERRVAGIKDSIQKSHETRTAKADQAVAVVKEQAAAQTAQDSVDVANQFIIDSMKKEG